MDKGRHRKENNGTTKKLALTAALGLGASVVPATFASSANAAELDAWERIAQCEASGRWDLNWSYDGLSVGGLQFINSSWHVALNRLEQEGIDTSDFPRNLYQGMPNVPTKQQQILAGEALLAVQGPDAWVCNWQGRSAAGALDGQGSMFEGGPNPFGDEIPGQGPDLSPHNEAPVLKLVNEARAEVGYEPLTLDPDLEAYARAWSKEQAEAGKMKHSDLDFEGNLRGENVAKGQDDAAEVFAAWMDSPDHKANILNPKFTKMGVAVEHDTDGEHYWTQVFASGKVAPEPPNGDPEPTPEPEPTPDPEPEPGPVEPAPEPGKDDSAPAEYTVVPGDTLYGIAERFGVPEDVPQGGIDARWHTLYHANEEVVGDNPHLIFPGQVLTIPEGSQSPVEEEPPAEEEPEKPAPKGELADLVKSLEIEPESHSDSYDRDLFGDYDRDAVLERDKRGDRYPSLWDGKSYTDPGEVDVDHTVALKEAWESGAHAWGESKLDTFASDMDNLHLLTDEVNQGAKSANDPAEWLPEKHVKRYVREWTEVKLKYGLSADQAEVDALLGAIPEQSKPPKEEKPDKPEPEEPAPNPDAFPGAGKFGPGANNEFVTRLGEMLLDRGADRFYSVGAGPVWTDSDRRATAAFQRAQGWRGEGADGIPGPLTWKLLVEDKGNDIPKSAGWVRPISVGVTGGYNVQGGCISRSQGCHSGVDFAAASGTPVRAVADATVVATSGAGGAYGRHVVLKLPDGHYALYAHLSVISVGVGETLSAGETVGLVGSTGNSSGPHLHFEIRNEALAFRAGNFLNPVTFMRSHGVTL